MNPDWDKLEACQQSLREHMEMVRERDAEIKRLQIALDDEIARASKAEVASSGEIKP